jgi:hypothetical protein
LGTKNEDSKLYTVNLNWKYNNSKELAPVYDFPKIGVGNFYSNINEIYTGYTDDIDKIYKYTTSYDAVNQSPRYIIDITPI